MKVPNYLITLFKLFAISLDSEYPYLLISCSCVIRKWGCIKGHLSEFN